MKGNIMRLLTGKGVSNYRISKDTGIHQSTLNDYAKKRSDIGNMTLNHALTLNSYYLKEMIDVEKTTWEFKDYTVHDEQETLRIENNEGETIGSVAIHDYRNQAIQGLNNGDDPIADGWEDGVGNVIKLEGWGSE